MRPSLAVAALVMLTADAPPQSGPTFRAGAGTVALYVTVQDAGGRLVPGLERADFDVRDNGRPADVSVFSNSVQPITMVLLVDMSSSMAHRYRQVRDSMLALVDALLPDDRVRLGPDAALKRLLTETSAYYLLGVEALPEHRDGNVHRITVKVKQGGTSVRSRRSVLIPKVPH